MHNVFKQNYRTATVNSRSFILFTDNVKGIQYTHRQTNPTVLINTNADLQTEPYAVKLQDLVGLRLD